MLQSTLFDLAEVAPTRGEIRAKVAAERRQAEEKQRSINRWNRQMKERDKRERTRGLFDKTCCLYWYPAGSGWTHCHKCHRPLDYTKND